jgi:hypothetical protein
VGLARERGRGMEGEMMASGRVCKINNESVKMIARMTVRERDGSIGSKIENEGRDMRRDEEMNVERTQ